MSVGGNVEVKSLSRFTAVENLYVSGTLSTSGSLQLGSVISDVDSDLILSSSATSIVAISGGLAFPLDVASRQGHITAINSNLILSSSVGSIVKVSGTLAATQSLTAASSIIGPTITNNSSLAAIASDGIRIGSTSFLRFKQDSSHGDTTEVGINRVAGQTSTLQFSGSSGSVCLAASNGHLILSSSAGSIVTVSGTTFNINPGVSNANFSFISGLGTIPRFAIGDNNAQSFYFNTTGGVGLSHLGALRWSNGSSGAPGSTFINRLLPFGTGSMGLSGSNLNGGYTLVSETGHLILSSTIGSMIKISGALIPEYRTSTTLPADATELSGAVVYLTDLKHLATYGPLGWKAILTGALV